MDWIDKQYRLPDNMQEILFCHVGLTDINGIPYKPTTFGGYYINGDAYSWLQTNPNKKERQFFTHWMPMPEPPTIEDLRDIKIEILSK